MCNYFRMKKRISEEWKMIDVRKVSARRSKSPLENCWPALKTLAFQNEISDEKKKDIEKMLDYLPIEDREYMKKVIS